VRLITRHGNDFTSRSPLAVEAVTALSARSFLLNREAIVTIIRPIEHGKRQRTKLVKRIGALTQKFTATGFWLVRHSLLLNSCIRRGPTNNRIIHCGGRAGPRSTAKLSGPRPGAAVVRQASQEAIKLICISQNFNDRRARDAHSD
jgi:hypothetical protein